MIARLDKRDLWILRQLRHKVAEWDIGDRVQQNVTAAESVLLLRAIDFVFAAEEYLTAQARAKEKGQARFAPLALPEPGLTRGIRAPGKPDGASGGKGALGPDEQDTVPASDRGTEVE